MAQHAKNKNVAKSSNAKAAIDVSGAFRIADMLLLLPAMNPELKAYAKRMLEMEKTIRNLAYQNLQLEYQF